MTTIGPCPGGIYNRSRRGQLPTSDKGQPLFASNANNLIFNTQGSAFSIFGPEKLIGGSRLRDAFSCEAGAFFRDGSSVKRFYKDASGQAMADVVCTNLVGERVAWTYHNSRVYFTDGIVSKKIINNACEQWGTPAPTSPPLLSGTSSLGSGQIMSCYSYLLEDGRESGTSPVTISSYGRVVSNINRSPDPRCVAVRVYMTYPGNQTLYLAATILPGVPSVSITHDYTGQLEPETKGKIPPPPGNLLCHHDGRIYIAAGKVVYWTDANADDLVTMGSYKQAAGGGEWAAWQFAEDITMMESVDSGIYVGADKTYFIPGSDPFNPERRLAEESKPELGAIKRIDTGELIWRSDAGFIKGTHSGQAKRMNFDNVSMDTSPQTAMGAMNLNGAQVVISVPQQPTKGKLQASDWVPDLINDGCGNE